MAVFDYMKALRSALENQRAMKKLYRRNLRSTRAGLRAAETDRGRWDYAYWREMMRVSLLIERTLLLAIEKEEERRGGASNEAGSAAGGGGLEHLQPAGDSDPGLAAGGAEG